VLLRQPLAPLAALRAALLERPAATCKAISEQTARHAAGLVINLDGGVHAAGLIGQNRLCGPGGAVCVIYTAVPLAGGPVLSFQAAHASSLQRAGLAPRLCASSRPPSRHCCQRSRLPCGQASTPSIWLASHQPCPIAAEGRGAQGGRRAQQVKQQRWRQPSQGGFVAKAAARSKQNSSRPPNKRKVA
jgi:hypothetical protein